uniref:Uncharacterized protein n=1 Tax=Avena sativa TaxID=4498 RepID=A0ACD5VRR2_AVESA
MSLEPVHRRSSSGGGSIASVCAALARLSLDLSGGGGAIHPGTLLDEYERLAIEAQLSHAVLRRSYSEPSPSRIVALQERTRPPAATHCGEEGRARRFVLLEALKRVWCWLSSASAWGWHGRKGEQPMPQPVVPAAPRVCLLDYLR